MKTRLSKSRFLLLLLPVSLLLSGCWNSMAPLQLSHSYSQYTLNHYLVDIQFNFSPSEELRLSILNIPISNAEPLSRYLEKLTFHINESENANVGLLYRESDRVLLVSTCSKGCIVDNGFIPLTASYDVLKMLNRMPAIDTGKKNK